MNTKRTCKPRTNRPWVWFVLATSWMLQFIQDVHMGKTYIYDLVAALAAVWLGVYLCRQNGQQKRRADR